MYVRRVFIFRHEKRQFCGPFGWCTVFGLSLFNVYCSFAHEFASFSLQERVFLWQFRVFSMYVTRCVIKHGTWQIRRASCHAYVSPEFKRWRTEMNNLDFIRVPVRPANSDVLLFSANDAFLSARTTGMSRLVLFLHGTFCGRDKV